MFYVSRFVTVLQKGKYQHPSVTPTYKCIQKFNPPSIKSNSVKVKPYLFAKTVFFMRKYLLKRKDGCRFYEAFVRVMLGTKLKTSVFGAVMIIP